MFQIRKINSVAIAIFFLASLTVVYGTYFICNTDFFDHLIESHSHDGDHHSESNDHANHSHEHPESSGDECCNDLTFSFFNGGQLLAKQFQVAFSSIGDAIIVKPVTFRLVGFENSGILSHFINPFPKVVNRQILYQSFII